MALVSSVSDLRIRRTGQQCCKQMWLALAILRSGAPIFITQALGVRYCAVGLLLVLQTAAPAMLLDHTTCPLVHRCGAKDAAPCEHTW